jgi:transposase InsO family protein
MCAKRTPAGHAPMQIYSAGVPWEVVAMDYIGPIPLSARRHRYILTIIDYFTRLTVLVPVRQQTAEATVQAVLKHWVTYYGVPRSIHSDQGTNFESELMTRLCERLSIRKTRTTAYRPQSDGRVERMNRTVKECVTRLLRVYAEDWDELLPFVTMAINSTVAESTGFTPFFLVHGTEMQMPIDLVTPLPFKTAHTPVSYADELLDKIHAAYEIAQQASQRQALRSKRRPERTSHDIQNR